MRAIAVVQAVEQVAADEARLTLILTRERDVEAAVRLIGGIVLLELTEETEGTRD